VRSSLISKVNSVNQPDEFSGSRLEEKEKIWTTLQTPPRAQAELEPFQFRPQKAQFITNDTLRTIVATRQSHSISPRMQLADNPITAKMAQLLTTGKEVVLFSYVALLPPNVEKAVLQSVMDGSSYQFFSNSRAAHEFTLGTSYAVDLSVKNIIRMANALGPNNKGRLTFYFFEPQNLTSASNRGSQNELTYLHRKGAIIDDTVVIGSDNNTVSSATKNNEYIVVFDDKKFAEYERARVTSERSFFKKVDDDYIVEDMKKFNFLSRSSLCRSLVMSLY
jgi:phosphatidylserine/phosphatidylglycerophosphate/cardiolipin synthase-like enzyme